MTIQLVSNNYYSEIILILVYFCIDLKSIIAFNILTIRFEFPDERNLNHFTYSLFGFKALVGNYIEVNLFYYFRLCYYITQKDNLPF